MNIIKYSAVADLQLDNAFSFSRFTLNITAEMHKSMQQHSERQNEARVTNIKYRYISDVCLYKNIDLCTTRMSGLVHSSTVIISYK